MTTGATWIRFVHSQEQIKEILDYCAEEKKAEREKVLDELETWCNNRIDGYCITLETLDDYQAQFQKVGRVVDELEIVKTKIEELRAGR